MSILSLLEYLPWDSVSILQIENSYEKEIYVLRKVNSSNTGHCDWEYKIKSTTAAPGALSPDFAKRKRIIPTFEYSPFAVIFLAFFQIYLQEEYFLHS